MAGEKDGVLNVTVILFDDGYASTAVMPIEVFHSAGTLWHALNGESTDQRFEVVTATIDGKPVRSPYAGLSMSPQYSIDQITQTDLIIVPTSGLALDEKLIEHSALLPWLRKHY